jgi:malonyl-CoA O-methyltransferase
MVWQGFCSSKRNQPCSGMRVSRARGMKSKKSLNETTPTKWKAMLEKAIRWVKTHSIPGAGVSVSSRQRVCYPEVTGYFIPTLLSVGERSLAVGYARWLLSVQKSDGSFGGAGDGCSFAFDTGQVIRGWVALLDQMPALEGPLRKGCNWLMNTADPTGRLPVPKPGGDWCLGIHGEINEAIHLYVLPPLRTTGEILNEPAYCNFADRSMHYYLKNTNLTDFAQPNSLTHFFAYVQEALLDLGCVEQARAGMASVERCQQSTGAVPAYSDVNWVCSTGIAQLAQVWYRLGDTERANRAMDFLSLLQNGSGGFYGSYGVGADYFPGEEISWAAKYAMESAQRQIASHFDSTVNLYQPEIARTDGRVEAVLRHLGNCNGKHLLDAGCGKGRYAKLIKKLYPEAKVTALDISMEMLRNIPPSIRTVQNSILSMPFADGEFDAVICIEALEHAVQIEESIGELARVLARGGKLVIIDKNAEKLGSLDMPDWEKWFDVEKLTSIMEQRGLRVSSEFVGHNNMNQPDGLFVCWSGAKERGIGTYAIQ